MAVKISAIIGLYSLILFFSGCVRTEREEKSLLYEEIDREISNAPLYDRIKEGRIHNIKSSLVSETSLERRKLLIDKLIEEYEAYESDSALFYVNLNLDNPIVSGDKYLQTELLIKKADIAAHAGLFKESTDILHGIDRANLDSNLLEPYYSAFCDLYQYETEYATDSEYAQRHGQLREIYIDSLSSVAPPTSINYIAHKAAKEAREGNFNIAEELLIKEIEKYTTGDRIYSILASILADIYRQKGDNDKYKRFIGMTVISDVKGAVKENMALRALATQCYEEGDFERADRYLRQSFSDANFYSARMRNAQSSRMLPIIGEAFSTQQKKLNRELRLFVIFMSVLAFGFIIISIFAFCQVRKVRKTNERTKEMLDEVSELSGKLSIVNDELSKTNKDLQYSNRLRGEYAALFLEYCSMAISSLQKYQQSLRVAATQGSLPNLIKKIETTNIENKTIAEFYSKFDEAVLNIYPNFVDKFNSLLRSDERIILKPNETLNTELRVFALIKIGIIDSEKIAKFLRCSISTIYTYRSKTKKKAVSPDTFEEDLIKI